MRLLPICFAVFVLLFNSGLCAPSTPTESKNDVTTAVIPAQTDEIEAVQLSDLADAGANHANEAERNSRFIGLGYYGGFGGGYGYRPWGYRPWGYGYGYRPWGGYGGFRPWGGYYGGGHYWG